MCYSAVRARRRHMDANDTVRGAPHQSAQRRVNRTVAAADAFTCYSRALNAPSVSAAFHELRNCTVQIDCRQKWKYVKIYRITRDELGVRSRNTIGLKGNRGIRSRVLLRDKKKLTNNFVSTSPNLYGGNTFHF